MNLNEKKLVVFDIDNTIVSTRECVMSSYRATFDDFFGVKESARRFPNALLETFVEIPLEKKLAENGVPQEDMFKIRTIYNRYNEKFSNLNYPIAETVAKIQELHKIGAILCVVTIKQEEPARRILSQSGVMSLFSGAAFRESGKTKADMLKGFMDKFGMEAKDCAFVGNMPYDKDAALDAGMDYMNVLDIKG